jgi:hypothetical protein
MRSNLTALQSIENSISTTQTALATGKSVNSAMDNPVNYFTAQSLTNRANSLLSFKDAISQNVQTITAADNAITSITSLINSAIGIANSAMSDLGSSATSQTLTISSLTGLTAGTTINIGGATFTAVAGVAAAATQFSVASGTTAGIAASLANAINAATASGTAIEADPMAATVSNNAITLTPTTSGATMVASDINFGSGLSAAYSASSIASGTELASAVSQYNTMMNQLNEQQADAFYNGKNLLNAETMTVRFGNNHDLEVTGFDGTASGLGLSTSANWTSESTIQSDIDKLNNALTTLQTNSSNLSSNLSIVNARQQWISDISNTLQTGSDDLTLADSNQEGADMLALQTRQSLSTSALQLANQSDQTVLKLFQ